MKAFLWHDLPVVSDNYHPGGALIIEAETLERAIEIASLLPETNEEHHGKIKIKKKPDRIFESDAKEEKVWVMPDSGCC